MQAYLFRHLATLVILSLSQTRLCQAKPRQIFILLSIHTVNHVCLVGPLHLYQMRQCGWDVREREQKN